jgi:hypothetical protein
MFLLIRQVTYLLLLFCAAVGLLWLGWKVLKGPGLHEGYPLPLDRLRWVLILLFLFVVLSLVSWWK